MSLAGAGGPGEVLFVGPPVASPTVTSVPSERALLTVLGEHYFGVAGALLAVPVASLVASAFKFIHRKAQELDYPSPPPPGG